MPPGNRASAPSLQEALFEEPYRFDFFQAVRLLARLDPDRALVGREGLPRRECVRFRALPSLSFPPSSIAALEPPGDPTDPPAMAVAFLGLYGPSATLPTVYTELIIERLGKGDRTLAAFLDLFNHRMVSLFYRAWEKYRPAIARERGESDDRFADHLYALMGLGISPLRNRLAVADAALLPAAGLFAQRRRPAVALEAILSDYFGRPVTVESFQGRWLHLDPDDCSKLSRPSLGSNNQLGLSLVLGTKVWDEQSKFRLRIGPLSLEDFRALLPGTTAFRVLCELTRQYVDAEFDFDVQLVLRAREIPPCQLAATPGAGPQLGRTTWLTSRPRQEDAREPIFAAIA